MSELNFKEWLKKYSTEKGFFIDFTKPVDVIIYNDKSYWETQIKFSNLPIINIISAYEVPPYYQETDFQLYSPNYNDKDKMQLINTPNLSAGVKSAYGLNSWS